MTKDLGVWTADECALVLIDYQKEMFEVIRSETSADLVEMQVRLLAKTAKAFARVRQFGAGLATRLCTVCRQFMHDEGVSACA